MLKRSAAIHNSAFGLYHSRSGFTLLEMMLALVLFAAGMGAILDLCHRAQAGATDGEHVLIATSLSQQCLEALRNVSFSSLTVGSGVMSGTTGCGSVSGLPSGSRSVTISQPFTNLKQISVAVSWDAPGGSTNVTLQTYRSNV